MAALISGVALGQGIFFLLLLLSTRHCYPPINTWACLKKRNVHLQRDAYNTNLKFALGPAITVTSFFFLVSLSLKGTENSKHVAYCTLIREINIGIPF
jgi:hypothetical protein